MSIRFPMALWAAEGTGSGTVSPTPAAEPTPSAPAAPEAAATLPVNEFPATSMEAGREGAAPIANPELPAVDPLPSPGAKPAEPAKPADAAKPAEPAAPVPAADAKPPEAKPEEAKPAEPPPPAEPVVPIEYTFTFPEDIKPESVNPERMGALKDLLNGARVGTEQAQKLLDMHIAEVREITNRVAEHVAQHQWDVFRTQQNAMRDEVRADPVLGGARFQTAMRTCATVIEQYGGSPDEQKALWDDLRATGMGNSPRMLRLFHRLGETFGREARMIPSAPPKQGPQNRQQRGEGRYANPPSR